MLYFHNKILAMNFDEAMEAVKKLSGSFYISGARRYEIFIAPALTNDLKRYKISFITGTALTLANAENLAKKFSSDDDYMLVAMGHADRKKILLECIPLDKYGNEVITDPEDI